MQLKNKEQNRKTRVRASIKTSGRPRLSVYRSNMHIWAQIIDDVTGKTIVAVNSKNIVSKKGDTKTVKAQAVGTEIAKLALAQKITKIVFDRGSYKFHGRVKAVATAARAVGLEF
ncbi:MAG: 50S ribosomal protein L18 [bacterium]